LTGFLFFAKKTPEQKVKSSRIKFTFKNQSELHFIDLRKFGKILVTENPDKILEKLGTDGTKISRETFLSLLEENASKNIKAFLMDQALLAGIGNEYSDELLFQAGINPEHKIKELAKKDRGLIYTKMKSVLSYATKLRKKQIQQTPDLLFFSKEGGAVFKSSYLQAHRHTDRRCPKDKNHKLKKVTVGGRSSYYCAQDQK
jgi:formamidopyrimidine-DNA glycosylase